MIILKRLYLEQSLISRVWRPEKNERLKITNDIWTPTSPAAAAAAAAIQLATPLSIRSSTCPILYSFYLDWRTGNYTPDLIAHHVRERCLLHVAFNYYSLYRAIGLSHARAPIGRRRAYDMTRMIMTTTLSYNHNKSIVGNHNFIGSKTIFLDFYENRS